MALLDLGGTVSYNYWRLLPYGYSPDLALGAGRVGLWGQPVAGLTVLGLKLQDWEEVFFPVKATFGNWAVTSPTSFSKCPACEHLLARPCGTHGGGTHKGLCFLGARVFPHCLSRVGEGMA